jgi:hypothetical protein
VTTALKLKSLPPSAILAGTITIPLNSMIIALAHPHLQCESPGPPSIFPLGLGEYNGQKRESARTHDVYSAL